MLSSGGLGYFEYEAAVEGDATLKLTVSLDQVDDVLKSLVVYDDKGGVGGLSLPGKEPLRQTFKDMPFDQAALESPAKLLDALGRTDLGRRPARHVRPHRLGRGEEPGPRRRQDHDQAHARGAVHRYTESSSSSSRTPRTCSSPMPPCATRSARRCSPSRPTATRTRARLELTARGQGHRPVRGAGIVTVPVWKASYRLPAGRCGSAKAALQGWATVEISADRTGRVELTLVSGRPVAFHRRCTRPTTSRGPKCRSRSRADSIPISTAAASTAPRRRHGSPPPPPPAPHQAPPAGRTHGSGASAAANPPQARPASSSPGDRCGNAGDVQVPRPVSVANGRTLSIPVIDRQVPAQRLALYQPTRRRAIRWRRCASPMTATPACRRAS